ncbi:MAG: lipopolysaccharide heptosyltransferase II [Deltaproteobacteria bacterium]|nr:lipopolysaccharide heptosyltransferase II [Deltaproteobacteria bacterium]
MPKSDIKNIIIRVPNWIGDAVLCLPAIEKIKLVYPQAEITVLAKPWVSPVFFNNPILKGIIDYDAEGKHNGIAGKWRLIQELKQHGFDMAVLFQNAFEAALIVFLAGISIRIGYARDLRGWLLTHSLKLDSDIKKTHQVSYYLNIISKVRSQESETRNQNKDTRGGVFELDKKIKPKIYLSAEEKNWADGFLQGKDIGDNIVVGMAPGASYGPAKRWMAGRFADVARRLIEDYGVKVILFGGKDDRSICSDVLNDMQRTNSRTKGFSVGINLADEVDLRKSIALLSRCRLFITNDSGPMHISASLDVPTVAIFGSTDPKLTGPLGDHVKVIKEDIECSPCFDRKCRYGHYKCMEMVSADNVYEAASSFIPHPTSHIPYPKSIAVFLDRDGTINHDTGYIDSPERLVIINGAASAIKKLNSKGFRVVVITNQSGIGRGYFSKEALDAVNKKLEEVLMKGGAHVDGIYYCPHHPDDNCECRKPRTGLLEKAKKDLNIDFKKSYVIGDKVSDVEIAQGIGGKGILVLTGMGRDEEKKLNHKPSYIAHDLKGAVEWIIKDSLKS